MAVVFAVTEVLATQLEKIGFIEVANGIPMRFRGEIVDKTIMINESCTKDHANDLVEYFAYNIKNDEYLLKNSPKAKMFVERFFGNKSFDNDLNNLSDPNLLESISRNDWYKLSQTLLGI